MFNEKSNEFNVEINKNDLRYPRQNISDQVYVEVCTTEDNHSFRNDSKLEQSPPEHCEE